MFAGEAKQLVVYGGAMAVCCRGHALRLTTELSQRGIVFNVHIVSLEYGCSYCAAEVLAEQYREVAERLKRELEVQGGGAKV